MLLFLMTTEEIPDAESGQLELDTYNVREGDFVVFKVIVTKDTRTLELTQVVQVIEGDPPDIRIEGVLLSYSK